MSLGNKIINLHESPIGNQIKPSAIVSHDAVRAYAKSSPKSSENKKQFPVDVQSVLSVPEWILNRWRRHFCTSPIETQIH